MNDSNLDFPLWINDTERLGTQIKIDENKLVVWVTKDALLEMGCAALPNEFGVACRTADWLPVIAHCRAAIESIASRKLADRKLNVDGSICIGAQDVSAVLATA